MPRHDDRVSMRQMLDYAEEIQQLSRDRSRRELDSDRLLGLGLTRLLEILGEAASRVSSATRDNHPAIPWSTVIALRNRLIHGYDGVDYDILWSIIERDVPALAGELRVALAPGQ